ncbi:MAG: hypothetical protein IT174_10600 [Acidobacteria bacterium]|nr:hypothetical protein [Acidobacteriota bacterium]
MRIDPERMPLFANAPFRYRCERCFDTGFWLDYAGYASACPRSSDAGHPTRNPAAQMAYLLLGKQSQKPGRMAFDLARALTHFTSDRPCDTRRMLDYFFADTLMTRTEQLRKLASLVEELRRVWRLPVGNRRIAPAGYWIITDLDDCKQWLRRASHAPKTQLATIWNAARAVFPILADQQEFDFLNALEDSDV